MNSEEEQKTEAEASSQGSGGATLPEGNVAKEPTVESTEKFMEGPKLNGKYNTLVSAAVVAVILIGFIVFYGNDSGKVVVGEDVLVVTSENVFGNIKIEAESFVVFDVNKKEIIYSKRPEIQLPLASLSKVMTAYVASEYLDNEDIVIISADDLAIEGDNGLYVDEKWRFRDIRDFTLVGSSNDGARALASAVEALGSDNRGVTFIDLMNKKAGALGLRQTYFVNSSGLDIDEEKQSGSYGSAKDMAILFSHVILDNHKILEVTAKQEINPISLDEIEHPVKNTNEFVANMAGVIASKTGFTDLAGGNLVIAFDAGLMQPYIIAVLGSSKEGRFEDVQKLHKATLDYIHTR